MLFTSLAGLQSVIPANSRSAHLNHGCGIQCGMLCYLQCRSLNTYAVGLAAAQAFRTREEAITLLAMFPDPVAAHCRLHFLHIPCRRWCVKRAPCAAAVMRDRISVITHFPCFMHAVPAYALECRLVKDRCAGHACTLRLPQTLAGRLNAVKALRTRKIPIAFFITLADAVPAVHIGISGILLLCKHHSGIHSGRNCMTGGRNIRTGYDKREAFAQNRITYFTPIRTTISRIAVFFPCKNPVTAYGICVRQNYNCG